MTILRRLSLATVLAGAGLTLGAPAASASCAAPILNAPGTAHPGQVISLGGGVLRTCRDVIITNPDGTHTDNGGTVLASHTAIRIVSQAGSLKGRGGLVLKALRLPAHRDYVTFSIKVHVPSTLKPGTYVIFVPGGGGSSITVR